MIYAAWLLEPGFWDAHPVTRVFSQLTRAGRSSTAHPAHTNFSLDSKRGLSCDSSASTSTQAPKHTQPQTSGRHPGTALPKPSGSGTLCYRHLAAAPCSSASTQTPKCTPARLPILEVRTPIALSSRYLGKNGVLWPAWRIGVSSLRSSSVIIAHLWVQSQNGLIGRPGHPKLPSQLWIA